MNTEKRRAYRAYWILLTGLIMLAVWAYLTRPAAHGGGNGDSVGIAGSSSGAGTGNGSGDSGSGSGTSGEGGGAGVGAETKNVTDSGTDAKAGSVPQATNGPEEQQDDGTPAQGTAPAEQLPKTALVQSLEEVAPAVVQNAAAQGGSASGKRGFYGVDVKRDGKVLFLVDVSGSMMDPSREFPGKTKLDVLKDELTKSICGGSMTPTEGTYKRSGGFIITRFSNDAFSYPAEGICRYHKAADVQKALEHVKGLHIEGGTYMIPGWEEALNRVNKDRIDTIYFLSDGEPSDMFTETFLRDMLKQKNVRKSLTIHCIAIGGNRSFMENIAKEHKGTYVSLP